MKDARIVPGLLPLTHLHFVDYRTTWDVVDRKGLNARRGAAPQSKGGKAYELRLTHFFDDRFDCLESVYGDIQNIRENLQRLGGLLVFQGKKEDCIPSGCFDC